MDNLTKQRIRDMRVQGICSAEIARTLSLPGSTVRSFCKKNGLVNDKETGRAAIVGERCLECGAEIQQTPHRKLKKFCSDKCRYDWWCRNMKKPRAIIVCQNCGKEFPTYDNKKHKYCSSACFYESRSKSTKPKAPAENQYTVTGRTGLIDLPTHCLCPTCQWFYEGKRCCSCGSASCADIKNSSKQKAHTE